MYKKISYLLIAVLCVAALSACGGRGGKTLVSVNGNKITEGDLDFLGEINPRIKAQVATPFGRKQILDNLVEQELLYDAAVKKGIQRDSKVKAKINLYKRVIISQSLIEAEIEKAAKEYYDAHKDEFQKLQLSHILIKYAQPADKKADKNAPKKPEDKQKVTRTKEQALALANKIKARLDTKEDFATVAKDVSEDAMSKNNGGDLGKASKGDQRFERRGYAPLLDKAFAMQVGEIAGPIETQDGFHIITVTKGAELDSFDEAQQAIMMKIQGEERNKLMADLKKDAKIVYAGEEKKDAAKPADAAKPELKPGEENKATEQVGNAAPKIELKPAPAKQVAKPEAAKPKGK